MNIRTLSLKLLLAFDALLTERNVSKAAQKIHITQPAMSHALEKLRNIFSDQILVRTSTGMEPTTFAHSIYGEVKVILKQVDSLLNKKIIFSPSTATQEFRLGVNTYAEITLIPKLVRFLNKEKSKIKITPWVVTQKINQLLEQGELDLAITKKFHNMPICLNSKLLRKGKYVCLSSRNHPILALEKNIKHYLRFPHIVVGYDEAEPDLIEISLEKMNKKREIQLKTNQFLSLQLLLPHTDLIATVSEELGQYYAKHWKLAVWPCPVALPPYEIIQVWHQRDDTDPGHQWLRNFFGKVSSNN